LRISPRRLVRCIGVRPDRPRTGRTWVIRACGEVPCQASRARKDRGDGPEGRIVHLASQQSIRAFGNSGAYGVSKAAICALARSQAEAWASHGVSVNAIAPGFIRTPLSEPAFQVPGRAEELAARTLAGRNGEAEDCAGAAVFLASEAARYVHGQTLFVDGGFSVH
ncbi:SDR family oxidoreductase, partial [Streptomyces sp. LHD-70]|uniref:SDR family NAD(P)-dependent oxidoreductase n=1 Tax=Streptomyces sp. LHD-70 TaxID=3072140 RepID=UPI00280E9016